MSNERTNERERECLLTDYREAGEDARYRDRLLYNSYYLAIILLIFIIQALAALISNGFQNIAAIVLFTSGLLYLFLTAWAVGVRQSRNNAWERRSEIEEEFGSSLQSNKYASLDRGEYQDSEKGLNAAYEHLRREPKFSEIPNAIHRANIDFIMWLLIPVAILSFILSIIMLFSGTVADSIQFWINMMERVI